VGKPHRHPALRTSRPVDLLERWIEHLRLRHERYPVNKGGSASQSLSHQKPGKANADDDGRLAVRKKGSSLKRQSVFKLICSISNSG
jgi:hypothetical protein